MTYRKLKSGTLYGQKGRYRAWIRKKDHGCYSALLSYGGEPIHGEGFLGTSFSGLAKWLNPKLNRITNLKN